MKPALSTLVSPKAAMRIAAGKGRVSGLVQVPDFRGFAHNITQGLSHEIGPIVANAREIEPNLARFTACDHDPVPQPDGSVVCWKCGVVLKRAARGASAAAASSLLGLFFDRHTPKPDFPGTFKYGPER